MVLVCTGSGVVVLGCTGSGVVTLGCTDPGAVAMGCSGPDVVALGCTGPGVVALGCTGPGVATLVCTGPGVGWWCDDPRNVPVRRLRRRRGQGSGLHRRTSRRELPLTTHTAAKVSRGSGGRPWIE